MNWTHVIVATREKCIILPVKRGSFGTTYVPFNSQKLHAGQVVVRTENGKNVRVKKGELKRLRARRTR